MTIDELIKQTKSRTKRLQDILFLKVLDYVVKEIYVKDDTIVFNQSNIAAINRIDKILEKDKGFARELRTLKRFVLNGVKKLLQDVYVDQSKTDIRAIEIGQEVNEKIIKHAVRTIDQMTNLTPIYEEVKKQSIALMSKYEGISLLELRNQLSTQIEGKNIVNKYWSRWTYDIYSQYERIGSNEVRKKLGFVFAIYEGGEIETTREFCSERNRKVFHESEIQKWVDLEWEGKNDIGYNPFIDLGGYNCRHKLRWISMELAEYKRPEVVVLFPMEFGNNQGGNEGSIANLSNIAQEDKSEVIKPIEVVQPSINDIRFESVQSAKDYIKSKGVDEIDMGKADLSHYNAIANALSKVPKSAIPNVIGDKSIYEKISGLKIKRKQDEWVGISLDISVFDRSSMDFVRKKIIGINSYFKNTDDITLKKIKYNDIYSSKMNGNKWYFNTFKGSTHFHEMGHIYDKTKKISNKKEWIDIANKWHLDSKVDMLKVSKGGDFSGENGSEAFAEAFASYYGNQSNGLPNYVIDYFNKNIK